MTMFKNLLKATVAVAVTPLTAFADAVMLIDDATEDREFAPRTSKALRQAGRAFDEAMKPERDER